ncbi:MAG: OmpA family protein [Saprospiraceae bacterium]|nr:OmpA family protein [Saprospiraceae bacterium]
MKKTVRFLAFSSMIMALLFTSCVSSKKFMASETRVNKLRQDSTNTHSQLNDCNASLKNVNEAKEALLKEYTSVKNNLNDLSTESKMTIADQEMRLKNLQHMIQSQNDVTKKLKNSIATALMNYKADELSVYIKEGNVYVSLAEKLLFKSGSDVVNPEGKEALKTLAKVLNSTKDINVLIEGHTDSIPIKTNQFKDNWDLSTARASSIVRILTIDYGYDSKRITASGRSQFHPVGTNDTAEGRASNRRTEIILSPDLKELYNLLYK